MKSYLSPSSLLALLLLLLTGCQTVAPAKRRDISQLPEAKRVCQLLEGNTASWKRLWTSKCCGPSIDENTFSYNSVSIDRNGKLSYTESQQRKLTHLDKKRTTSRVLDISHYNIKPTDMDLARANMLCDENDQFALDESKIIEGHDIHTYYQTKGRKFGGVLVTNSGMSIQDYKSFLFMIQFPSREKAVEFQNAFKSLVTAINSLSH